MLLLVVRHAIAVDQEEWAGDDAKRPLTDEGRKKMKKAAQGLRQLVKDVELLAASALVRAYQTAEILAEAYGLSIKTVPALAPGQPPAALARWLEGETHRQTIAIVGHEPGLSSAVSWFLTGADRAILELKKGGACLLDLPRGVGPATATLLWALWPSHLRDFGDS